MVSSIPSYTLHEKGEKKITESISKETRNYDKTMGTHEMLNNLKYTTFFFHSSLPLPNPQATQTLWTFQGTATEFKYKLINLKLRNNIA